jgi:YkoY family integral membrane protein
MFHQTFAPRDLLLVLLLVLLEGLLSIDNALVLGLLARRLPVSQRAKALSYGLIGSFGFRVAAVATAGWLLKWPVVKLIGGGYLLYVVARHFFEARAGRHRSKDISLRSDDSRHGRDARATRDVAHASAPGKPSGGRAKFWPAVLSIEITDAAFAIDSILAGIALVGPVPAGMPVHPKLWVVLIGGMLGVVLMRFAAAGFIWLLGRFPRFEISAYLLVTVVALKLVADWAFGGPGGALNFESASRPEFWIFWGAMATACAIGFLPERETGEVPAV